MNFSSLQSQQQLNRKTINMLHQIVFNYKLQRETCFTIGLVSEAKEYSRAIDITNNRIKRVVKLQKAIKQGMKDLCQNVRTEKYYSDLFDITWVRSRGIK